ncbi:TolB family protein, partial [Singulisphaera rosea]
DASAGMIAIDPATAKWRPITKGLSQGPLSPDGRFLAYSRVGQGLEKDEEGIWVDDLKGQTPPRRVFEQKGVVSWWPDGRQVVITTPVGGQWTEGIYESWRIAFDGSAKTKLPIPDTEMVLDCSRDGSWLATRTDRASTGHRGRITIVHPDGTGVRHITEGSAKGDLLSLCRFSPDGRTLAYVEFSPRNPQAKPRLYLVDIEGKSRRELSPPFESGAIVNIGWSPDGIRLALGLMSNQTKQGKILITDLEGKILRTIALSPLNHLMLYDWRPGTITSAATSPRRILDEPSAKATSSPSRARYRALVEEYEQAWKHLSELRVPAKNKPKPDRASADEITLPPQIDPPHSYARRFLEIAESAPDDRAAVDALAWVVEHGFDGPEFTRAVEQLAKRHADSPR